MMPVSLTSWLFDRPEGARGETWSLRLIKVVLVLAALLLCAGWSATTGSGALDREKAATATIPPCSLLTVTEVAMAVGYQVKASPSDEGSGSTFVPGGVITYCTYTQANPPTSAATSAGPREYTVTALQPDFTKPESKRWTAVSAQQQFDHAKAFSTPSSPVSGLGVASFWWPRAGTFGDIWTLSGDIVFEIGGQTSTGNVSESVDATLMRKVLARA